MKQKVVKSQDVGDYIKNSFKISMDWYFFISIILYYSFFAYQIGSLTLNPEYENFREIILNNPITNIPTINYFLFGVGFLCFNFILFVFIALFWVTVEEINKYIFKEEDKDNSTENIEINKEK